MECFFYGMEVEMEQSNEVVKDLILFQQQLLSKSLAMSNMGRGKFLEQHS
jgi:hypothetical protein